MKSIKDYSEEIYKCTKCGLCQCACPVFEETGLECAVSRGKFSLLNGINRGDLEFTQNVSRYLDMCLSCNACSEFCPSDIDAEEILTVAKYEGFKRNHAGLIKRIINSCFNSNHLMKALSLLIRLYRRLNLPFATELIALNIGKYGKLVRLFNSLIKVNIEYVQIKPFKEKSKLKIMYFPGCINNFINPSVKNAVKMVFEANGFDLIIPDFSCCGIPARSMGDLESFKAHAVRNLDKIDDDIDYLMTDCASCGAVWKLYSNILENDYKEKADRIASKAANINELLLKLDIFIPVNTSENSIKVTYHDPCHLKRFSGVYNEPREILSKIPGVEFVEMNDSDKCCGAAGTFCIFQSKISKAISEKKAENIINSGAKVVSTSCPSCKIGLEQGLLEKDTFIPVLQPVELLAALYAKKFG